MNTPTPLSASQKGSSLVIWIFIVILVFLGVLAIYSILTGINFFQSLKSPYNFGYIPSDKVIITPTPVLKVVELSNAWNLGTKQYSNPKINITFNYPSYFELSETDIQSENQKWAEQYKNDKNARQPLYSSSFLLNLSTPNLTPTSSSSDITNYEKEVIDICNNTMRLSVQMYENPQNLTLYDFIADLKKTYPGDGITETFDTYKKDLKSTNTPKIGSYVFEGIVGENPVKTVYFINKDQIYSFGLVGNCDTGGQYTPDADKIFQNILQSIKF